MSTTVKGFKVTDAQRKLRVGIATATLEDLKRKTLEKFKSKLAPGEIYVQTQDGTRVESQEYFATLPAQTLLIWAKNGERAETDAEILYKTIREVNEEYLNAGEKVQEFFTEKMKSKVFKLAEVLKGFDAEKVAKSSRSDHPEWFEGLDSNAKTKEEYMFRRAQDRIRTYFYRSREELLSSKRPQQRPRHFRADDLKRLLDSLSERLKLAKYNGHLFDRTANNSLCDREGSFRCQGRWDRDECLYGQRHLINPYASRECRIVFQTWNLDHGIERTRTVLPAVLDALDEVNREDVVTAERPTVDVKRIYNDLFTVKNLKFVHIVCHDKGAHVGAKAGPYVLT